MKYRYDAFISYRHTELDKFAAENLHRQMEAFRLPGKFSGRTEGRTRITRVFRDRDELPLTNSLEGNIMEALRESEYLIVICSPRLRTFGEQYAISVYTPEELLAKAQSGVL